MSSYNFQLPHGRPGHHVCHAHGGNGGLSGHVSHGGRGEQGGHGGQDRTFQVTCDWQLSQFLRYFSKRNQTLLLDFCVIKYNLLTLLKSLPIVQGMLYILSKPETVTL